MQPSRNVPVIDQHVPDVQPADGTVFTHLDNADAPFQKNSEVHP
jgi:hypothetical protein